MGPPKKVRISQEAFDEVVRENIQDLGMDPTEALSDAIHTLSLQGVDLSGILTCVPGEGGSLNDNAVIHSLERLKQFDDSIEITRIDTITDFFYEFLALISGGESSGNTAIAVQNGGLQLLCSVCAKLTTRSDSVLVLVLKTLALLLYGKKKCPPLFVVIVQDRV